MTGRIGDIRLACPFDPHLLAPIYAHNRRLLIPDVLLASAATAIHDRLAGAMPWRLAYSDGTGHRIELSSEQVAAMDADARNRLAADVATRAADGHQIFHNLLPLDARDAGDSLAALSGALRGADFLDFVRTVTGIAALDWGDAEATAFASGHFTTRTDGLGNDGASGGRCVGFELMFNTAWKVDWGGLLLFFDDRGQIREGFTPTYNALALFALPQLHAISCVAPFTGAPRLAVRGWLRTP